ncbi:MAG: type II toxin-antitoxin system VapB family antitoxin [Armatimonadota bacterium]|nr:type II toxin-antitoxin system VapB family antitoxin [Armatimonadota bacterium]
MARFSITVEPELLEEAMKLAGVKRKREVIELALREFVRKHRLANLQNLVGSGLVEWTPEGLAKWREAAKEETP